MITFSKIYNRLKLFLHSDYVDESLERFFDKKEVKEAIYHKQDELVKEMSLQAPTISEIENLKSTTDLMDKINGILLGTHVIDGIAYHHFGFYTDLTLKLPPEDIEMIKLILIKRMIKCQDTIKNLNFAAKQEDK